MSAEVSTTNRLVKAVAVMGSGTLVSRVLGLIRLMLIVAILGSSTSRADMFWVANLIPNTLLLFLAGGVLNTVLVPQISRAIKLDADGGEGFVNRILTAFVLAIGGLTVLLTVASPVLAQIYVSGQWRVPELGEHYANILLLTYLCVPQLFFYGIFFLLSQVLNARDQFGPAMWAPIVNNVASIGVFGLFWVVWGSGDASAPFTLTQMLVLGVGSTLGIVAQLLVLLPFMRRTGFTFTPRFDLRGAGLGRTASLAKWTIYYVVVSQLTLIVVQRLASSATAGGQGAGMTVYSSAEMLWLLPHSLITVSLATAMLSSASRLAAEGNLRGVAAETMQAIRFAVVVLMPASVALAAFAYPISRLLFGYGSGGQGASYIGTTLIAFSAGLVPYTIQFVCNRTFYAIEDTRTAFLMQLLIAVLNAVLAIILVVPFDNPAWVAPALAASVSVSYLAGVVLTVRALKQALPALMAGEIVRFPSRLLAASLPGGLLGWFIHQRVEAWLGRSMTADLLGGMAGGVAFLAAFWLGARVFHLDEVNQALARLRRWRYTPSNDLAPAESPMPGLLADGWPTSDGIPPAPGEKVVGVALDQGPHSDESVLVPSGPPILAELIDTVIRPAIMDDPDDRLMSIVESGQTLSHRYSLQDRLIRRGDTETWLAFDQVLSRLVLVHLLPTDTPRLMRVLDAARKGAVATESRFLRVLDAVEFDHDEAGIGGYVVCEYVPGQNLGELLSHGPLSAIEAAWIVREVADAMATMHAQGLFHERLSPDTVLISASGNAKIVGFGVESALAPQAATEESWFSRERSDVRALGKLLYACLVHRWPGGDAWGMRAAPRDQGGEYLTPRQVRQGVSPVLDSVCDQILSEAPRRGEQPLRTAADIVYALSKVLGTADASSDHEQRLRYPTVHDSVPARSAEDSLSTTQLPVVMVETDEADFPPEPLTIRPPADSPTTHARPPRRRWLLVLVSFVAATLVVALAAIALQNADKDSPSNPDPAAKTMPTGGGTIVYKIAGGRDFDPDGDNTENPKLVPLAFDGKADTGWTTERYRKSAKLGGLKPGVGIVLDLGEVKPVSSVKVALTGEPTSMEFRVPSGDGPGKASSDWKPVASVTEGGATIELKPETRVETRYVLVWVTSLPQVADGRFEAKINEVTVLG